MLAVLRCSVLLGLLGLGGLAQGQGVDQDVVPMANRANILPLMLNIIDRISTIIPGQGFNSIKIGDNFERLIALWGSPHRPVNRRGVEYQLDTKTTIQFIGKRKIKRILVHGLSGSLARVNNGITFGMSAQQIREKFNLQADKDTPKVLRYKRLGITFILERSRLVQIHVFAP